VRSSGIDIHLASLVGTGMGASWQRVLDPTSTHLRLPPQLNHLGHRDLNNPFEKGENPHKLLSNHWQLNGQTFMAKFFISNKDESARLFKSDFLEKFTHVHWSVPIILYIPAAIYFLTRPSNATTGMAALLFLGGVLFWTLTEYMLHRFVFHYHPSTKWGQRIHFLAHGVHHDYPNDSRRLVMPPSVSLPLAGLFYGLFSLVIPGGFLSVFFAGFLVGYVCYDTIHYATHHAPLKGKLGHWLKHHHLQHHYLDNGRGYGVSTPLWDYVFGTMYEREDKSPNQV